MDEVPAKSAEKDADVAEATPMEGLPAMSMEAAEEVLGAPAVEPVDAPEIAEIAAPEASVDLESAAPLAADDSLSAAEDAAIEVSDDLEALSAAVVVTPAASPVPAAPVAATASPVAPPRPPAMPARPAGALPPTLPRPGAIGLPGAAPARPLPPMPPRSIPRPAGASAGFPRPAGMVPPPPMPSAEPSPLADPSASFLDLGDEPVLEAAVETADDSALDVLNRPTAPPSANSQQERALSLGESEAELDPEALARATERPESTDDWASAAPPASLSDLAAQVMGASHEETPSADDGPDASVEGDFEIAASEGDDAISLEVSDELSTTEASADAVDANDQGPEIEPTSDEPSEMELSFDDAPALEGDDDGPVFETEDEDETTISIEQEDEPEDDRGALLAATVTSRQRDLGDSNAHYARTVRGEVEARFSLLESEAALTKDPRRAAEYLALAGELAEGVQGDVLRARELYESSLAFDARSTGALRGLRGLLAETQPDEALQLADREMMLDVSDAEVGALEMISAELASRVGPEAAQSRWERVAAQGGVVGALAKMFDGGLRHDEAATAAGLDALSHQSQGALAGAASLARARLAEGNAQAETALVAVREAVNRDPRDVGSWLAMARIAIGREDAKQLRQALVGLAKIADEGSMQRSAMVLDRTLGSVMSEGVEPLIVDEPGVEGWLMVHALRDGGHDDTAQIAASHKAATTGAQVEAWDALTSGESEGPTAIGRLFALRRAIAAGDRGVIAQAAAATLSDPSAAPWVAAALAAEKSAIAPHEISLMKRGEIGTTGRQFSAVLASAHGADQAANELTESPWSALALAFSSDDPQQASATLTDAATNDQWSDHSRAMISRFSARFDGALETMADMLRAEADRALAPTQAATLRWLAATMDTGVARADSAERALSAQAELPSELALAELVALHCLRGDAPVEAAAAALEASVGSSTATSAERALAVRGALRRGGEDPASAADALFSVWSASKADGSMAALLLRALDPSDVTRRALVLSDMAERAQSAGVASALGAWVQLASELATGGRVAEAAQAVARARQFAIDDPSLLRWEESLWLRAGMYESVAERAFDALKSAETDMARAQAYDALAELDSTFRHDVASAVLTYQAILEIVPGHATSLRVLERYFVEQGRAEELLAIYDKLIGTLQDPDAVASLAHTAARLAMQQAEGDVAAGAPYVRKAFERGAYDDRLLAALEAEARRSGGLEEFVTVLALRAERAEDPAEKALHHTRRAEALLLLGRRDDALAATLAALESHPTMASGLRLYAQIRTLDGAHEDAASALEQYANAVDGSELATIARIDAATLWQDQLGNAERARAVLDRVLEEDPAHPVAFPRMLDALASLGDRVAERQRIEARLSRGAEKDESLRLRLRVASIAEDEGDNAGARQQLRQILTLDEGHADALRTLVRLSRVAEDWPAVADATIRLARVSSDASERTELLFALGEAFDGPLQSPQKAETAFKRVQQMSPEDIRPVRKLADLYARTGQGDNEAAMLEVLVSRAGSESESRALRIRLAAVLSERLDRGAQAESVLRAALEIDPTNLDTLRAFARLYMRMQRPDALADLLDSAAAGLRGALVADLQDVASFEVLADVLKLRGHADGARVVAAIGNAIGLQSERLKATWAQPTLQGAGVNAISHEALELLAPPSISPAHRELLRLGAEVLERLQPFEPGAMRAEKLGARPHPLRAHIDLWAKRYGIENIEIYLGPPQPIGVLPIGRNPAAVMVGVDLTDTPAARFAVARAMTIVAMSLSLFVRLPPLKVTLLMAAMGRQFDPMFMIDGVDMSQVDDLARRITRVLQRPVHAEMQPHAISVFERRAIDGDTLRNGTLELAARMAVLAGGDFEAAVAGLAVEGSTLTEQLRSATDVGKIVRVALSDRFLEARRMGGADRAPSGS